MFVKQKLPTPCSWRTIPIRMEYKSRLNKKYIYLLFTLYFKFWEGTSVKSYKIPALLFLVYFISCQLLYQYISFWTTFEKLDIWKKNFALIFPFLTDSLKSPASLTTKSSRCDKSFCWCSLRWYQIWNVEGYTVLIHVT